MNRRTFVAGAGPSITAVMSGCLVSGDSRDVSNNPSFPADDHENHIEELTVEIERRGLTVRETEHRGERIIVDYDSEALNDDLAKSRWRSSSEPIEAGVSIVL